MTIPTKAQALEALLKVYTSFYADLRDDLAPVKAFIDSVPDGGILHEIMRRIGVCRDMLPDDHPDDVKMETMRKTYDLAIGMVNDFAKRDPAPADTVGNEWTELTTKWAEGSEPVAVADLREGDRVRVTFEGVVATGGTFAKVLLFFDDGSDGDSLLPFLLRYASTIHRLPPKARLLEKGELLIHSGALELGIVLFIDGDHVALKGGEGGNRRWFAPIAECVRQDGTPIEVAP